MINKTLLLLAINLFANPILNTQSFWETKKELREKIMFLATKYVALHNNKPIEIVSDIKLVAFKQMIEEGTAVSINNLFFNFGKYDLLPYSIPELKRVAKIIII